MSSERKRLDDNLYVTDGDVRCSRCGALVGRGDDWLRDARVRESPPQSGGSLIHAAPELFVDAAVVYRQAFCPGCLTVLLTEVVAAADRGVRVKDVTTPASRTP